MEIHFGIHILETLEINIFIYISGSVKAIKDLWFVGDLFINDIYYTLAEANQCYKKDNDTQLYLYSQFNVQGFVSNPLTKIKEAPARLVNSLIHALNEKPVQDREGRYVGAAQFLPRFIIIIVDWDIVKHIGHFKFGMSIMIEKVLKWIITNMECAIMTRKEDLLRVKLGAIVSSEPKIIWVKMLDQIGCQD